MEIRPKKMNAAVVEGLRKISIRELDVPEPAPGEVLIKIDACLLCTWEQRIYTGESGMALPFIPGHEAAGVIAEIPDATITAFKPGDPVVFKTLDHCGHCSYCYRGFDNQCTGSAKKRSYSGIPGSGGLAQYIALDINRVFPLQAEIPFEEAAFSEPLACCIHSVNRGGVEWGDDVVIIGAGIMGQLHAILARLKGARVIVIEPREDRRARAREMGAHVTLAPGDDLALEEVRRLTKGEGADVVFNTAAMPEVAQYGLKLLKKMGRMVFYGSFHPNKDITINPNQIHYSEIIITGSSGPATKDFLEASRMLAKRLIKVKDFISKTYPLEDVNNAFEASLSPDSYRVAVKLHERRQPM